MSPQRIAGVVFLVVGIALFIIGVNASDSLADQLSDTFTGKLTDKTTWYILGGIALAVIGALITFIPGGRLAKQ